MSRYSRRAHFKELLRLIREAERHYGLGHPQAARRSFETARVQISTIIMREPVRAKSPHELKSLEELPGAA